MSETAPELQRDPIRDDDVRVFLKEFDFTLGSMTSNEFDRTYFGPLLVQFIAGWTPQTSPDCTIAPEAVIETLSSQAAVRQTHPKSYQVAKKACINTARANKQRFPLVHTAFELKNALYGYDADLIADDILAALGAITNRVTIDLNPVKLP